MNATQDELGVRKLVEGLVAGWNAHDGTAFARQFATDADFTNVMGLHARGRDVIARGHDEIFATMFRGTTLTATVEGIRFLRPDVAAASVVMALQQKDGMPWGPFPRTIASLIAVRDGESWSIAVFHNMVRSSDRRPARSSVPSELHLRAAPSALRGSTGG